MQIIRLSSHQNSTTGVRGARAWVDAFTGLGYPNGLAVLLSWLVNLQLTHTHKCGAGVAVVVHHCVRTVSL